MRKERVLFFIFFIIVFSNFVGASLGLTPAKYELDFTPNEVREFKFATISDRPDKEIEIYLEGKLTEYAKVSKIKVRGSEEFIVTVNFPNTIRTPGDNSLIVRAKEVDSEGGFIGSKIIIGALIKVFVPYPGKYIDVSLNVPDVNENEIVPIEMTVFNRGKEEITFNEAYIKFLDNRSEEVHKINFNRETIDSLANKKFKKSLGSSILKPGSYGANLYIDYGGENPIMMNQSFRVGTLFVNITSFTGVIEKKGIQKFLIGIESKWNNKIENIFADVVVFKNGGVEEEFRTPPINLNPWEERIIESFLETNNLEIGEHDINITLRYLNSETVKFGKLKIVRGEGFKVMVVIGVLVVVAVLSFLIGYLLLNKRKQKNKKRRKY